ncbi:uncharacterized protein [Rutidosis leptorrhynchoides]|uniref:uncharacterized protein n=1 Tax=Rutidosis leptorrhynchoides TaxID=125765 RepID=UPI003A98D69A
MQQGNFSLPTPFALIPLALNHSNLTTEGFELSRFLILGSILLSPRGSIAAGDGDGMDFSKVGEKFLSSVRSARSIGFLPSTSDRPEVPERAATAATIARALASIPPHQRQNISSSSEQLSSMYGSEPAGQVVEELEQEFYEEEFDPVRHTLENIPSEESDLTYFEGKAALRLLQLDKVTEMLSHQVMEHHEVMVKGMDLVGELEKDLKIANVICMNGRRHLTSSRNEVSRDLVVNTSSRRKQTLLNILQILSALRRAKDMQEELETHVDEENFFKAFQVLSEYLQLLDSLSELLVIQEMSRGVEIWLGRTLQKLDSLLLGVCQEFKEASFLTVVDAYALIGDVSGLAEKIQSFFMQEVISETHTVLKSIVLEDLEAAEIHSTRLTYSDLCTRIPESEFRQCLLATLASLFKLMCSYHAIMNFHSEYKISMGQLSHETGPTNNSPQTDVSESGSESRDDGSGASSSGSPWFQLRNDATMFVSQTLERGRRNLWQLTTSRVSVLLSSSAVSSTSIHQFLKIYEDLNIFILVGEAFCGAEAVEFRQKVKAICENYYLAFHRQNIHALKMVLEKESWFTMPPETVQVVSFAGLIGDGAALISQTGQELQSHKSTDSSVKTSTKQGGFSHWTRIGNPFCFNDGSNECDSSLNEKINGGSHMNGSSQNIDASHTNGHADDSEDENEDLLADFIDEDSQLPSRIVKPKYLRKSSLSWIAEDMSAHTGSSICVLRLMDKYARLMQKLEIINVEFFKGICQLFGIFFHFVFESFCHQNANSSVKGNNDALNHRLKTALHNINQDCNQWIKSPSISDSYSSHTPLNMPFSHMDITPTPPNSNNVPGTTFGLKERCAGADTISLVARLLYKSKAHLQLILPKNNATVVEEFYSHLVDSVPDLTEQIHRTTAKLLLHISGYADRIANAKWEVKELGMEHNGYVDLLLGEFKHYKTRLAHGGIRMEVQDLLIGYGLDNISEILVEGLSRVKRCSDEGRALMLLDLQVLINGLQHFVTVNVKPKLQTVETFIKAYYLPETEYVHWARAHPEYTKSQIAGLINLVATMQGWKRKNRLEVLEKIGAAGM